MYCRKCGKYGHNDQGCEPGARSAPVERLVSQPCEACYAVSAKRCMELRYKKEAWPSLTGFEEADGGELCLCECHLPNDEAG